MKKYLVVLPLITSCSGIGKYNMRPEEKKLKDTCNETSQRKIFSESCSICLCELPENKLILLESDDCYVTQCGHAFHADCMNLHKENSEEKESSCPTCRQSIEKKVALSITFFLMGLKVN